MFEKILLTAALTAALFTSGASAQESAPKRELNLSLDSCISIALSDNPSIRVADMEIRRMDYSKKETIGQLLPSVAFGATYNRTLAKQTMYMNMGRTGASAGSGSASCGRRCGSATARFWKAWRRHASRAYRP